MITPDMLPHLLRSNLDEQTTRQPLRFKLPAPYADWQKMLVNSKIKLMVFPSATKSGKSLGGSSRLLHHSFVAPKAQDALFRVIAPTFPLSKITYQYLNRLVPDQMPQGSVSHEKYLKANNIWRSITPDRSAHAGFLKWKHNGATIQCIHGSDPEVTIEGARVHGNCFDEAGKLKRQVFDSAMSTVTQTGGWNCLYGTPRGKNFYYDLFMECQDHMAWAARTGKPLEMFAAQARTVDNPFVPQDAIERARKHLPDRIFRQLYLAEFLDDGSVFVGYRDCVAGDEIDIEQDQKVQHWADPLAEKKDVVIGVDWAKREDFFVAAAIDVSHNPPKVVGFVRATHIDYTACVRMLYNFGKKFNSVLLVRHDRTGVGDVIDELIQPLGFTIEPVVFTNASKAHLVERYMVALQTKNILLPNWKPLIDEHDNYDATTTQLGLPKYGAIAGEHDDIVTALMLAYSACEEMRDKNLTVRILEDLPKEDHVLSYYNQIIEDDDEDF